MGELRRMGTVASWVSVVALEPGSWALDLRLCNSTGELLRWDIQRESLVVEVASGLCSWDPVLR